jgi:hypothetical protein
MNQSGFDVSMFIRKSNPGNWADRFFDSVFLTFTNVRDAWNPSRWVRSP